MYGLQALSPLGVIPLPRQPLPCRTRWAYYGHFARVGHLGRGWPGNRAGGGGDEGDGVGTSARWGDGAVELHAERGRKIGVSVGTNGGAFVGNLGQSPDPRLCLTGRCCHFKALTADSYQLCLFSLQVIIALVLTNLTRLRYPVFWWTLPPPNPAPLLPTSVSPERSSASSSPPLAAPKSKSGKPRRRPPQRSLSRPRQVPSDCEDDAGGDWMDDEIGERVDTALGELEIMDRIGEAEEDGAREERRGRTRTVAR